MIDIPDLPEWVPIEKYGIGIPFVFLALGLWLLYFASSGVMRLESLSVYGRIGVTTSVLLGVLSVLIAGYTYSHIKKTWWVETKDPDVEPIVVEDDE